MKHHSKYTRSIENQIAFEILIEHIKTLKRGDHLMYDKITELTGVVYKTKRWKSVTDSIRYSPDGMMAEENGGIWLEPIKGTAFLLCDKSSQFCKYNYHTKKSLRQYRRAEIVVTAIPDEILSELDRFKKTAMIEKAQRAQKIADDVHAIFSPKTFRPL